MGPPLQSVTLLLKVFTPVGAGGATIGPVPSGPLAAVIAIELRFQLSPCSPNWPVEPPVEVQTYARQIGDMHRTSIRSGA